MQGRRLGVVVTVLAAAAFPLAASGSHAQRAAVAPCAAVVHHDVLPVWMRGGFGNSKPRIAYTLGKQRAIGAILFGSPLNAPPDRHKNNKILWVPRRAPTSVAPLWIRMQQMNGTRRVGAPVRRVIATGPGPSLVDAPAAGCWRLTLSWSGRRDTLDLAYVPPKG